MKILFKLNPYLQQRQKEKPRWIFPIKLAMYATTLHNQKNEIIWDKEDNGTYDKIISSENEIDIPFLKLPHPNRVLTDAKNPKWQKNGNFKFLPGTYIQVADGCWHGKCIFCVEQNKKYECREVKDVLNEVKECIDLEFKEIFDDSPTFPIGKWLAEFAEGMILKGYNKKIRISCNMRLDYHHPNFQGLKELHQAGFRMILYGLESANQSTLDKINKGINIESAIQYIKRASRAGLEPHVAYMIGYPWETYKDALKTLKLVHYLLRKNYAKTAQASLITPFEKTLLFKEYGKFPYNKKIADLRYKLYNIGFHPEFWIRRIFTIYSIADLKYLWKAIKAGLSQ
jgi:radical SAM superfamily enzyme YgiQ (UPF0313 family)